MTILYSDLEPLSQYSPVKLHLSPVTRILSENPMCMYVFVTLVCVPYMELFKKRGSTEVVLPKIQFTCLNKT